MQINFLSNPIWLILKIFFIVGLSVYAIFALVVIRQVQIMTGTVKLPFELPVKLLALIHFIFAIAILALAFIVL